MSKTTTYSLPQSNGSFSINGKTKATTKNKNGTVYGNYIMDNYEKQLYDYAQKTLAEIIPNLNTFSKDTMDGINSQLAAYQRQGEQSVNSMYQPLLNNLKNDIASRFGNIDNSMFLEKLNNVENYRSNALAALAENLITKRNELINNELSNRYSLVNLLNALQNQSNANALNALGGALNLANSTKGQYGANQSPGFDFNNLQSMLSLFSAFI